MHLLVSVLLCVRLTEWIKCEIRPSHASTSYLASFSAEPAFKAVKKEKFVPGAMVKGRNEPALLPRVAYVIAGVKGVAVEEVVDA